MSKKKIKRPNPNPVQLDAIVEFARRHGRGWKGKLEECWMRAGYPGCSSTQAALLQQVRNQCGPSWLADFELPPTALVSSSIERAIASDPQSAEAHLMRDPRFQGDLFRSYGPGKYSHYADAYLHELSMDALDDEVGEAEYDNYYSLVRGPFLHPQIAGYEGAILFENSQGFVEVVFYPTKKELYNEWKRLSDEVNVEISESSDD